jgi:putative nucleotidyltransferase with HDIG domain
MKRPRPTLSFELMPSEVPGTVGHHATRWGLLVALALLTYTLFPVATGFESPLLEEGEVASEDVIAPFDFDVLKSEEELARERAAREGTLRPIFDFRVENRDSVLAETDLLFAGLAGAAVPDTLVAVAQRFEVTLTVEEAEYLRSGNRLAAFRTAVRRFLGDRLRRGVARGADLDTVLAADVMVRWDGREGMARRDTILTFERLFQDLASGHPDPNSTIGRRVYVNLLGALFRPTLVPNIAAYEAERRETLARVDSVKYKVRENQGIIFANEVVTTDVHDRLVALSQELLNRGGASQGNVSGTVGQVLTNGMLLTVFWLLLMLYRPRIYDTLRQILVLSVFFALVVAGAAMNARFISGAPELIPVPLAAMLTTVMFRGRVAMVAAMVLAVLVASQAAYGSADALFIALVGGVAAAVSVRTIRRRNQFLFAAGVVAVAYLMAGVAIELRVGGGWADVGLTGVRGGLNAVACAALASTLLPVFEWMGGVTTELTLLELSDPDRPLLRRLAVEAPGTYAHSVAMANLCEAACNAVGAQGLLARVGCYYHDVGKLKKPQHFVENQSPGANPHDKLKPEVSAGIVRNHVREGLALADEQKLPDVLKSFIAEHHGTMEITYFLQRARNRTSDQEIKLEDYRYPGPRPQTLETAVAMLADGVEAAIRVLDEPTPDKISDAIDHIVRHRVDAGQLGEAPLTLAQLARVKEEFARVIGGTYHNRIDYPAGSGGIGAEWEATSEA